VDELSRDGKNVAGGKTWKVERTARERNAGTAGERMAKPEEQICNGGIGLQRG